MKIVVLDGYTENPGDLSWDALKELGEVTVYDRTSYEESPLIAERIGDAEIVIINKTPISKETIDKCPNIKLIAVLATGYNVVDYNYAKEKDIPIIFFNREPVQEDLLQWDKLFYVGCDAAQSGEMQGEIAAEYIKNHPEVDKNGDGKIQYVLLEGEAGHQDAISRTDLSVKTMIENEIELEKLSYQFADWNRAQAENRMSRLISQYGDQIEMVISNNDEMALGAVEAYKNAGYMQSDYPVIFGIDGLDDALEGVRLGTMQGTVYNDRETQARKIALIAVALFRGNDVSVLGLEDERYYMAQYRKVDVNNVDEFLQK